MALMALCLCVPLGCEKKDASWPEYKTCERCKEEDIKFWADICKHCGKDPDGIYGEEKRANERKIYSEAKQKEKKPFRLGDLPDAVISFLGFLILFGGFLFLGKIFLPPKDNPVKKTQAPTKEHDQ